MNIRTAHPGRRAWYLPIIVLLSAGTFLAAQDSSTEEQIFELNPFEVSSGSGYIAQRTLAGTRLNSELVNVPQQISVFTEDFLDDIAATSPQDAMLYSLNVENLGEFTDPGDSNVNRGIGFNTYSGRVRGIADSGTMRDFFETNMEGDTYNLTQITVSSGPNAVIYGLGGTGGVINSSFKRAMLGKSFTTLGTRIDSESSMRFTLDFNQQLIKDKLAVRFIGLWDDFQTYRNSSDGEQHRYFATMTARPWKGANITAYYEDVDISKALPRNVVAYDGGVTAYLEHVAKGGDPYYDNSQGTAIQPGWEGLVQKNNQNREYWILQGSGSPVGIGRVDLGNSVQTIPPHQNADPSDRFWWSLPEDSPIVSLEHNIHGLTTGREQYGEIYGIIYNQEILRNLHIELGANFESGYTDFYNMAMPTGAAVRVDPNMYMADGVTPNPYKGMIYVDDWGQSSTDFNEMWGYRASVSYTLDLTEVNNWLGRHNFMGLYTEDRYDRFWSWIRTRTIPADRVDSYIFNAGSGRGQGQTYYRWYIDPVTYEMVNPFDPLNGGPQPDGSFVYGRGNAPASGFTWSSLLNRKGATGAIQSFWFKDRLVTTLGYRQGWFRSGSATVQSAADGETVQWGNQNIRDVDRSLDKWAEETKEDAINYGAVLHLTDSDNKFGQWSIFYNWADIFNSPTPSHNADGSGIPAAIGESYDFGVIWTGLDNKAGFRINFYNTKSANANTCNWCNTIRNNVVNIEQLIGAPGRVSFNENNYADDIALGEIVDDEGNPLAAPVAFDPSTFDLERELSYWHMTADRESEGVEIEAWANPTRNWTFRLTAAKNEATDVNGLKGWDTWIQQRYSYYKAWAQWEQDAYRGTSTTPLSASGGSVTSRFNNLAPAYTTVSNADGTRVNQNSGWRVNFTGRYEFTEGKLDGAHVGAHIRFREAPVIGYISLPTANPFPDFPSTPAEFTAPSLESPVEAPSRTDFDMFAGYNGKLGDRLKYTIRLNIRNVLDDTDKVPMRARADGTTAVYTFKPPRTFILSVEVTY